ncbi:hypothetical protein DFH09DRAFT_854831, partial [Mycena vulgaris]
KWLSSFDGVPVMTSLINLDDYDRPVRLLLSFQEKMLEAVELLNYVCHSPLFQRTVIHVLNTSDSFRNKHVKSPLSVTFSEYSGGSDYQRSVKYIL